MGPKKQIKKQVVQEPPKEQQPQIPPHQLQGYGRFQYINGVTYEGNWRLFRGIKMKHGNGILTVPGSSTSQLGRETYDGNWQQDKMDGYGVYHYPDGSIYRGEWKRNQQNGKGTYQFSNGTIYEGEWRGHNMHGSGYFIDHLGRKWEGEYRDGKFESRKQKELVKEKAVQLRKHQIRKQVETSLQNMLESISKSDKKTLKDNFGVYFPVGETIKQIVRQPYSKFDERPPQKWAQLIAQAKIGEFRILKNGQDALVLAQDRILSRQLEGIGQIVQIISVKDEKTVKLVLANVQQGKWVVVNSQEEEKKK